VDYEWRGKSLRGEKKKKEKKGGKKKRALLIITVALKLPSLDRYFVGSIMACRGLREREGKEKEEAGTGTCGKTLLALCLSALFLGKPMRRKGSLDEKKRERR